MSDVDKTVTIPRVPRDEPPAARGVAQVPRDVSARAWPDEQFTDAEDRGGGVDVTAGLISLSFLTAALRRRARIWCLAAVLGLLLGAGLFVKFPPAYQATTSVVLTHAPGDLPIDAMNTDAALAQSRAVAARTVQDLRLPESATAFQSSYSTTVVTDKILVITVSAPSTSAAVYRAEGLATAFLRFRAQQLESNQQLVIRALTGQVAQAKATRDALDTQVNALAAQPGSTDQRAKLGALRAKRTAAINTLTALENTVQGDRATMQVSTSTQVNESQVLDHAAPVLHSRLKLAIEYTMIGLIAGLALGMGLVVIQSIVSDRLRRRDDVAHALGASVRLSVGKVRLHRLLPGRRGLAAAEGREIQRIVGHLRGVLDAGPGGALTVVAVDSSPVAAVALAALALSCAKQGKRVILADLTSGVRAARLLNAGAPGVGTATVQGTRLVVSVPGRNEIVPVGPLTPADGGDQPGSPPEDLVSAHSAADLLLTLITLDPSLGGEHLATWATSAAVIVTAGESTPTRIHAVGEMIRLAGVPLVSAVLVGADKTDESLGVIAPPVAARQEQQDTAQADPDDEDLYGVGSR